MVSRVRIYDAEAIAVEMRETFMARPVELRHEMPFGWPTHLHNIGDSLAVAYASDKWEKPGSDGSRRIELYKHLAESRNRVLVLPGLLRDEDDLDLPIESIGPTVSLAHTPMPEHFAVLGLFEEVSLQLYTRGTDAKPRFGRHADDGVVRVEVRHGMLGASKILYNETEPAKTERSRWMRANPGWEDSGDVPPDHNQPFVFVYTESEGVLMIVLGEKLDISHDGIVG